MRLNQFLSQAGVCSRRKADELISAGKIQVNGHKVVELGVQIDPNKDEIFFENKKITLPDQFVYYALNKPYGVVSTAIAQENEKTVLDLVPKTPRVYPVGRLDKNSKGLIVLTNDGELTKELTHPSFEHQKRYRVLVKSKKLKVQSDMDNIANQFISGIKIDDKLMRADTASIQALNFKLFTLNLVLHTGYNRQIRKMCGKIGLEVTELTRTGIGKLDLDKLNLKSGQYCEISKDDIL